eukprot:TRINITY_DN10330_c0_g3_i1.p1 TRINITY_DN10330_c0_g3~~TRINITY_DN10330_c0_g3_i1.p1  ORF type:complete len:655 (-),score=48.14 TRINITY_DN10330_c0_g3_i1:156-2120(-)
MGCQGSHVAEAASAPARRPVDSCDSAMEDGFRPASASRSDMNNTFRPAEPFGSVLKDDFYLHADKDACPGQVPAPSDVEDQQQPDTFDVESTACDKDVCFLVHGMWGSHLDWETWVEVLAERFPAWSVKPLESLSGETTLRGRSIEELGAMANREISEIILKEYACNPRVSLTLHFIGHSLGGLIIRSALATLFESTAPYRPTLGHYLSLSTPHLGIRASWRAPRHVWKNASGLASRILGTKLLAQIAVQDTPAGGADPYLVQLSDPAGPYLGMLLLFRKRTCATVASSDPLISATSGVISPCYRTPFAPVGAPLWYFSERSGFEKSSNFTRWGNHTPNMGPYFPHGMRVYIKSHTNLYLQDGNGTVKLSRKARTREQWALGYAGGGKVTITSSSGRRLQDCKGNVRLSKNAQAWEQWVIGDAGRGKVIIKSHRSQNLQDNNGALMLSGNEKAWERWSVVSADGTSAFCFEQYPSEDIRTHNSSSCSSSWVRRGAVLIGVCFTAMMILWYGLHDDVQRSSLISLSLFTVAVFVGSLAFKRYGRVGSISEQTIAEYPLATDYRELPSAPRSSKKSRACKGRESLEWRSSSDGTCRFPSKMALGLTSVPWQRVVVTARGKTKNVHVFLIGKRKEQLDIERQMSRQCVERLVEVLAE